MSTNSPGDEQQGRLERGGRHQAFLRQPLIWLALGALVALVLVMGLVGSGTEAAAPADCSAAEDQRACEAARACATASDYQGCERRYLQTAAEADRARAEGSGGFASTKDRLLPILPEVFGARFGGNWIDRSGPETVQAVGVVDATPADQDKLRELAGGNERFVVVPVRYSLAEGQAFEAQAEAVLRQAAQRGKFVRTGIVFWDFSKQKLRCVVQTDPATLEELRRAVPAELLDLQVVPLEDG